MTTQQNAQAIAHWATAAIAGPALIWAGYVYPGSWKSRLFLGLTGVAVIVTHYSFFDAAIRPKQLTDDSE